MNGTAELLNYVYQNAKMGVETIPKLLEILEPGELREYLCHQLEGYRSFLHHAEQMLSEEGREEKDLSLLEKMQTSVMLKMQTLKDKSPSHIAEMLIQGSTMGVTEALKKLGEYQEGASKEAVKLMKGLKEFEEKNIDYLKKFITA